MFPGWQRSLAVLFPICIWFLSFHGVGGAQTNDVHHCPGEVQTPLSVLSYADQQQQTSLVPGDEMTTTLRIAIPPGGLCTLIRITTDDDTGHRHLTPAGRSYDGGPWESVQPLRLPFDCVNATVSTEESHCVVGIPPFDRSEEYYLVSYYQHSLSREQEISRLLQQTTFGPKLSEIRSMMAGNISAAQFIQQQMEEPPTLHRAYYRRNTQARLYESYPVGKPRHPCEKYSRWRRFAFTVEDRYKRLTVSTDGPPYLLSVDGFLRTEVMELNTYAKASEGVLIPGYDGMVCGKGSSEDEVGGESIRITDDKLRCRASGMPNPPLELRESTLTAHNITFIALKEDMLQAVNEERAGRDELISLVDLDDPICAEVPLEGTVKPVFARLRNGSLFMHDPFLTLEENTPEKPLREGGQWGSVQGVLCPSAPRNLMFEQDCFLSDLEDSCSASGDSGPGIVICPSPGEVANDPLGDTLFDLTHNREADGTGVRTDFEWQRWSLWVMVALSANDQLRQRVAWALYLIIPLEGKLIDAETESHTAFFDLFVRHAFGNYRDLLRDISYSPWMAEMLSFEANKSTDYVWRTEGRWSYPDENFARELIQLFTIGMYSLKLDGSHVLDENGNSVETYDTNDVQEMARAWTGFAFHYPRGNVEAIGKNFVDPLQLKQYRDFFPKRNLYGGFLGDGYPLCNEAPPQAFLRKGATYRLLGKSSTDTSYAFDKRWLYNGGDHLDFDPSEELYKIICNSDDAGEGCNHRMRVVLNEDIDPVLQSNLTKIDTVRLIKVADLLYEYHPSPCVELSFYNDAKKVSFGAQAHYSRCANPRSAAAGGACCKDNPSKLYKAFPTCEYTGERITYNHLVERCNANDRNVPCDFEKLSRNGCGTCCNVQHHSWTPGECSILAKVNDEGQVSIVHNPEEAEDVDMKYSPDARNFFRVSWGDGAFPSPENNCGDGICTVADDGSCICETRETTRPILSDLDAITEIHFGELQSALTIGSYDPASYDPGTFTSTNPESFLTRDEREVMVWRPTTGSLEDVIIALPGPAGRKYYRNKESSVQIVDVLGHVQYNFRNPPSFGEDLRDAAHETEALLDHLFYHSNTAPFISHRLIQRLGTSNPSPGYIERVASAFTTGMATFDGIQFGSGSYGCLKATFAAILLDRELRSVVLDADPSAGSLREPLVRFVHLMRSMEFKSESGNGGKLILLDLEEEIGEMPYGHPSVFSFFLPTYSPPGPISSAGLVSPEATLLTQPYVVGLVKGLVSLIKYGMVQCEGGFGHGPKSSTCLELVEGNYERSEGYLHYAPTRDDPESIVSELDLLLTGGRLSKKDQTILTNALKWEKEMMGRDVAHLVRLAQQLIIGAPEYHTSGLIHQGLHLPVASSGLRRGLQQGQFSDAVRNSLRRQRPRWPRPANWDGDDGPPERTMVASNLEPEDQDYKAIIYLLLIGGNDGFNMFVPHSNCKDKDLYQEYADVRGNLALEKEDLLPIDVGTGQPCSTFGLHPSLSLLAKMFNESDVAFIANSGLLYGPSDSGNYSAIHETTRLFAHDAQRRDTMLATPYGGDAFSTGMLGRTVDVLAGYGYAASSVALDNNADVLNPAPFKSNGIEYINARKPTRFHENPSSPMIESLIRQLNNDTVTLGAGIYGQSFSAMLKKAQESTDFYYDILSRYEESPPTKNEENDIEEEPVPSTSLGAKLDVVKKLIWARRERKVERDVFFVTLDGFDMHKDLRSRQAEKLGEIDSALKGFIGAMKTSGGGVWDDIVIASSSDFGRTLTANSNAGSDHAWASHQFLAGGSVKGGQVFGNYPETLMPDGKIILGRGRVVPTTANEAYWSGILSWFGLAESDIGIALPNRDRTTRLFTKEDMFYGKESEIEE